MLCYVMRCDDKVGCDNNVRGNVNVRCDVLMRYDDGMRCNVIVRYDDNERCNVIMGCNEKIKRYDVKMKGDVVMSGVMS